MAVNLTRLQEFFKHTLILIIILSVVPSQLWANDNHITQFRTPNQHALIIDAMQHIEKKQWEEAHKKVVQAKDPLGNKLYHWLLLLNTQKNDWTNDSFLRLSRFIRLNPQWPEIKEMKILAEGVMPENIASSEVLEWYDDYPPQTAYGMQRYTKTLLKTKQKKRAQDLLMEWWAKSELTVRQQQTIFREFGGLLTVGAHKRRFDALLHKGNNNNALEIANILGQGYPELARARIALKKNQKGLDTLIQRVPENLKNDSGLLYERLRWRRKRKLNEGALEILAQEVNPDTIHNIKSWWTERRILIRRLLEQGHYEHAYYYASRHIQRDGVPYAQAQWLAGWLALRFMQKPNEAYERFSVLYSKVKTPISRSRAAYWAGRAAQQLGQKKLAQSWYKNASEYQMTFYGQLAIEQLSLTNKLKRNKLPQLSTLDERNYKKSELVQASDIFRALEQKRRADQFMNAFLNVNQEPKAYRFMAEKLAQSGEYHAAVKVAKKATQKGLFLTKQSYPTITKHLVDINTAEWALIHAIIRQESVFDYKAKSHAGALGLMQLLPSTAKEVSRKLGLQYQKNWLTARPKYNMTLGAAYIAQLINYYDGSYPLAIAAYNAGPGRVNKWLKLYGDPRKKQIDLIDWIELIPIYETRNYVQRVLEGTYIYRLLLENIQLKPKENIHVAFNAR